MLQVWPLKKRDFEVKLRVTQRETEEGGINWEDVVDTCTLLYKGEITNRDLLYSIGRYTHCFVIIYMGKKNSYMYIYN